MKAVVNVDERKNFKPNRLKQSKINESVCDCPMSGSRTKIIVKFAFALTESRKNKKIEQKINVAVRRQCFNGRLRFVIDC